MGFFLDDSVFDGALNIVKLNANRTDVNTAQPATRAAAVADSLATGVPTFTGPVNGDVSGRKLTINALNGLTATATGTANHISLSDATILLLVTTCTAQGVSSGNTVNIAAFDYESTDPA